MELYDEKTRTRNRQTPSLNPGPSVCEATVLTSQLQHETATFSKVRSCEVRLHCEINSKLLIKSAKIHARRIEVSEIGDKIIVC